MKQYTVHDQGRIIGTGVAPDLPEGAIEGWWSGAEYYVADGRVAAFPPRPSESHRFDYADKVWRFDADAAWAAVRARRNRRIAETDWTVLPDVQMSEELRTQWEAYRQALRDVTEQPDPLAIVWPRMPG